ncbi:MAG: (2Fe-2S)-binding protein [Cyclobacteriaceae bacterium]|nr:(2Fe-2S)-binding protein [Cyclobacteriaceae bacterium]
MVKIVIENLGQKEVPVTRPDWPVLRHLQEHQIDWMHACGAKGRCTTCRMKVLQGGDSLGPVTPAEQKYRKAGLLREDERLACQAVVTANLVIRVPDDSKLPHLNYTD